MMCVPQELTPRPTMNQFALKVYGGRVLPARARRGEGPHARGEVAADTPAAALAASTRRQPHQCPGTRTCFLSFVLFLKIATSLLPFTLINRLRLNIGWATTTSMDRIRERLFHGAMLNLVCIVIIISPPPLSSFPPFFSSLSSSFFSSS